MSSVEVFGAWRKNDPKFEKDAIALWQRLGVIPPDQQAERRAKQLTAVAYLGDELVGATTAFIDDLPALNTKGAINRILISPEHRGMGILSKLMGTAFQELESWAAAHPEEGVSCLAGVRQDSSDDPLVNRPFNSASGTTLIGYTDSGKQIRIRWFGHYRV